MSQIHELPLEEIFLDNELNCREGIIQLATVSDLARNIEQHGLIQPIVVHLYNGPDGEKYRIVAGHRRYRAFELLKRETIPAIVREDLVAETDIRLLNLTENLARKELSLIEESQAIRPFINVGWTQCEVAERLGVSQGWVNVRTMFLRLPHDMQEEWMDFDLPVTKIREVAKIKSIEGRYEAFRRLKEAKLTGGKPAKVRITNKKRSFNDKRVRKIEDIDFMLEMLQDALGPGLGTRLLAWVAGRVSDDIIIKELRSAAKRIGRPWYPPADYKEVGNLN